MNTHPSDLAPKGRKVAQVLKGAQEVFMSEGFEGANVDDIAKTAGVSKATLYSYYPDKRALFAAVAQCACQEQTSLAMRFADEDGDFAEQLFKGCRSFMEFMCTDFGVQMFRTVIAEAARFPDFGKDFWSTGPGMAHAELIEVFKLAIDEGVLKPIDDLELAAETLTELCKVYLHPRLLLGVIDTVEQEEIDRIAHHAVDVFISHYGA